MTSLFYRFGLAGRQLPGLTFFPLTSTPFTYKHNGKPGTCKQFFQKGDRLKKPNSAARYNGSKLPWGENLTPLVVQPESKQKSHLKGLNRRGW